MTVHQKKKQEEPFTKIKTRWFNIGANFFFIFFFVLQIKQRMEMCIRGEEELIQAFQMDRKLEVNKWKRLGGQRAAGDEFFCSSSPSPSTISQVCLNCPASCTKHTQLSLQLKDLLLKFIMLFQCLADKNLDKTQQFMYDLLTHFTHENLQPLQLVLQDCAAATTDLVFTLRY